MFWKSERLKRSESAAEYNANGWNQSKDEVSRIREVIRDFLIENPEYATTFGTPYQGHGIFSEYTLGAWTEIIKARNEKERREAEIRRVVNDMQNEQDSKQEKK